MQIRINGKLITVTNKEALELLDTGWKISDEYGGSHQVLSERIIKILRAILKGGE